MPTPAVLLVRRRPAASSAAAAGPEPSLLPPLLVVLRRRGTAAVLEPSEPPEPSLLPPLLLLLRRRRLPVIPVPYLRRALVAAVLADPALAALIGARLRAGRLRQDDVLPAVTWQVISNPRGRHLDGASGVTTARVQFNVVAKRWTEAEAGADALRRLFDGYSGTLPPGVVVLTAHLDDERDDIEAPAAGQGEGVIRVSQDYLFFYREPAAERD